MANYGPFDLTGDVALVTGSRGRLGKIWIAALRDAGALVVESDTPLFAMDEIRTNCDITVREQVEQAMDCSRAPNALAAAPGYPCHKSPRQFPPGNSKDPWKRDSALSGHRATCRLVLKAVARTCRSLPCISWPSVGFLLDRTSTSD